MNRKLTFVTLALVFVAAGAYFFAVGPTASSLIVTVAPGDTEASVFVDGVEIGRIGPKSLEGGIGEYPLLPGKRFIEVKRDSKIILREEIDVPRKSTEYYLTPAAK